MNIVITGTGRGIGLALVNNFLEKGHSVMAISRSVSSLEKIDKGDLTSYVFDLENDDFNLLTDFIKSIFSKVDILINNAGYLVNKSFTELTDEDFDKTFNVNVKAPFKLSRCLVPVMNVGSHIVNISSMGGIQGSVKFPGLSVYSAAKGAVAVLSEAMALELKEYGISVNSLALGAVQTEMLSEAFPGYKAPLNPDEMANFITDFALSGHKYFNGKIIPVSLSTP